MNDTKVAPRPNLNPLALPTLALAGRAGLTFRNVETGTHFTAKIKQLRDKADRKVKLPIYYVHISLLNDGVTRMRFAGTLFSTDMRIKLANGLRPDDRLAVVFRWLVGAIKNPVSLRGIFDPTKGRTVNRVGLFHENRCCHCGLPLTHPESIYNAYGPVCFKALEARLAAEGINVAEMFAPVEQIA